MAFLWKHICLYIVLECVNVISKVSIQICCDLDEFCSINFNKKLQNSTGV